MGNTSTVPIQQGETVVNYLRRKFKSKSRKPDNLVAQELREEEAEELAEQEPLNIESLRRIHAIEQDQTNDPLQLHNDTMQLQLVPVLPGAVLTEDDLQLVPRDQRIVPRDHHIVPRDRDRRQQQQSVFHRPPPGHLRGSGPYRARMLLQEATPSGSRTYSQDVSVDEEFVEERICYEETYRRRRSTVVVRDIGAETEPTVYTGSRYTPDPDSHQATAATLESQTRSRFSRFRQMTMNFFRGRSRGREENRAIEDSHHGDYIDKVNHARHQAGNDDTRESRPGSGTISGRSSSSSLNEPEQATRDGVAEEIGTSRKDAGNIRRKSGDVAVQKGPDRGIVWPKKMEELYSKTDKAYYIEQFQRTELFRQRLAKKEQGKTNWLNGLTPFQTWVLEHVGTPSMDAILKPKVKARPNNTKAKVNCWRKDKPVPRRRHKMEE